LLGTTGDSRWEIIADIVDEYDQWLIQTIEQRKRTDQETVMYLEKLRQNIERIITSLEETPISA
jgi:hypothetical protein